jgi:hypothetical protein
MTRQRILRCNNPDCPHEKQKYLSDWVRAKLPDSKLGYMVSDFDFILFNYKSKKIIFIESKTFNKQIATWQRKLFTMLNRWLKNGTDDGYTNFGFHLVTFQNSSFEDGKVYFDNKEVTESELINKLSFNGSLQKG